MSIPYHKPQINQQIGECYKLRIWKHRTFGIPIYPYAAEETERLTSPKNPVQDYHTYFLVVFLTEGELTHKFGEEKINLKADEILIVPPGFTEFTTTSGYHKYLIGISGQLMREIFLVFGLNKHCKFKAPQSEFLKIYQRLFKNMHSKDPSYSAKMIGDCMTLLSLCAAAAKNTDSAEMDLAEKIRIQLEQQCCNPQPLAALNESLKIPHTSLHRIFKEKYGISPKQYQFECRMKLALDLLNKTDKPIKEIAFETGFQNQHYFANAINKKYNASPTQIRNQARERSLELIMMPGK